MQGTTYRTRNIAAGSTGPSAISWGEVTSAFAWIILAGCLLALAPQGLRAAENLAQNGTFNPLSSWQISGDATLVSVDQAVGGISVSGAKTQVTVRQLGLAVHAGRTYRVSCSIRPQECAGDACGVTIITRGWTWGATFLMPKAPTADWTECHEDVTIPLTGASVYDLVIRGPQSGRFSIKDIVIRPLDAGADRIAAPPVVHFSKDNLVENGDFSAGEVLPDGWVVSGDGRNLAYDRTGGKGGRAAVGIRNRTAVASLRQPGLVLVPGETYRLSGFLRSRDFTGPDGKTPRGGVAVITDGWKSESSILVDSSNSDWTYFEKTFIAPPTDGNTYAILVYSCGTGGEVWACDLRLAERRRSVSAFESPGCQRPFAIGLRADELPAEAPRLLLGFPYVDASEESQYTCQASTQGFAQAFPLKDGRILVDLAGLASGAHALELSIVDKRTGLSLSKSRMDIRIVPTVHADASGARRLNGLVTELRAADVGLDPAMPTECTFENPRDGWVFVAVTPSQADAGVGLALPGDKRGAAVAQPDGPVLTMEVMRWLPAGAQVVSLTARQQTTVGIVVRSIPELFYDAPNYSPYKFDSQATGRFDWAFTERYILPCTTTFIRGKLDPEQLSQVKARGMHWLSGGPGVPGMSGLAGGSRLDADDLAKMYAKDPGFADPRYDGLTADEFYYTSASPLAHTVYTRAIERLRGLVPAGRAFYPWVTCGMPYSPKIFGDFFSQVVAGNGLLLFEAYPESAATEADFTAYGEDFLVNTMRICRRAYPEAQRRMAYLIGVHALPFDISQFSIPGVDRKYLLDLTVHTLANSPEFVGLGGLGIYTSGHADEETLRWTAKLIRHYAIDGGTEMLSKQYGYTYLPGIVDNGDFTSGGTGWECSAAEPGSISFAACRGYGKAQMRWGLYAVQAGVGDSFALLRRSRKAANRIDRRLDGLIPGRLYAVEYAVADHAGISSPAGKPGKYAFTARVTGGQAIPERCYLVASGVGSPLGQGRIFGNIGRVVFRADGPSAILRFSDWITDTEPGGAAGQELMLNYVNVAPYFAE